MREPGNEVVGNLEVGGIFFFSKNPNLSANSR